MGGDICPLCCGNEREVTIDCPRHCPFLQEARAHERYIPVDPKNLPSPDVELSEEFLEEHRELVVWIGMALGAAARSEPRAVDSDVREALDALSRSYRTLTNGLVYESRPVNPFAAAIFDDLQDSVQEFKDEAGPKGKRVRDVELLAIMVLFLRFAWDRNNGRPKGRSLIEILSTQFQPDEAAAPDEPRLIEL